MQIVIDIKKREWEYLNKLVENGDQLGHYERLLVNGTSLPKGHGRLIDVKNIRVKPQYMQDVMGCAMIRCEDLARILADAPTIIEADKSESEAKK